MMSVVACLSNPKDYMVLPFSCLSTVNLQRKEEKKVKKKGPFSHLSSGLVGRNVKNLSKNLIWDDQQI